MGGGFGRRGNRDLDFIMDAVMLSKEVGRHRQGDMDPRGTMCIMAASGRSQRITCVPASIPRARWSPGIIGSPWDRIGPYYEPVLYQRNGGRDNVAMLGGEPRGYDVPHQLVEHVYRDTGVRTNPLRGNQLPGQQVRD